MGTVTAERSVRVKVDLDDKGFDGGMKNVDKRLNDTNQSTKLSKKDMDSFGKALEGVGTAFASMAVGAVASMAGIAALSPTLSGSWAKLKNETRELSDTLASAFKPVIDVLIDAFGTFNDRLESFTGFQSFGQMAGVALSEFLRFQDALYNIALPKIATSPLDGLINIALFGISIFTRLKNAIVDAFSPVNGQTPPAEQGYNFKPGTMSVYDQASMGGSLKNSGLPSSSPSRVWDNDTGSYRLETRQDRDKAIVEQSMKNMNLNATFIIKNDGSDQQKISRQFLISPSFG